jgi:hypothetical protein
MSDERTPLPPSDDDRDSTDQPRRIDLGTRSFAGENVAEDQRHQAQDRGAGLGAGSSDNREARYPVDDDREHPEDDLD